MELEEAEDVQEVVEQVEDHAEVELEVSIKLLKVLKVLM